MTTNIDNFFAFLKAMIFGTTTKENEFGGDLASVTDTHNYLLPVVKRWGWNGFRHYMAHPPIRVDRNRKITAEDLAVALGDKFKAPTTVIGTRKSLMERVCGLSDSDFNKARTFDYYEDQANRNQIHRMVDEMHNPVAVFNNWLRTQVRLGTIKKIDGLLLKGVNVPDNLEALFSQVEVCPIEEFLERYFLAYRRYNLAIGRSCYSNVEVFARDLIFEYSLFAFGLSTAHFLEEVFQPYTAALWEFESKKSKTEIVSAKNL